MFSVERLDSLIARALHNRRLMRIPVAIYRMGLGFIFGRRLVMIEHLGRVSDRRRFVVVECIERFDRVVRVASGFGRHAQWYRNLAANEVAYVSTGARRRIPATPRLLTEAESELRLRDYAAQHPTAWKHLEHAMELATGHDPEILVVDLTLTTGAAA
jgi:deazaflavin-dependent oxidoreductase (nitroreductase family)